MKTIALFIVLIAQIFAQDKKSGGTSLRFGEPGLEYASRIGPDVLKRLLDQIKDQTLQDKDKGYKLSNVSLSESDMENFKIILDPKSNAVLASVEGLSTRVSLNYAIESKSPYMMNFEGRVGISFQEADLNLTVSLGVDSEQRPKPKTEQCNVQIRDIELDFESPIHHIIYRVMKAIWPESVRSWAVKMICDQVTDYIDNKINENVKLLQLSSKMDKFRVDYGFLSKLSINPRSIEARHKGEIFWDQDRKPTSSKPDELPSEDEDDAHKMFNLRIGEYLVESFAESAHSNSYLKARIADDTVSTDKQRNLLRTTCSTPPCAGSLIPELSANADTWVQLEVSSNRVPEVLITEEGLRFHLHGDVIVSTKKDSQQQFKLKVIVKLLSKAHVFENRLIPEILTYDLEIKDLTNISIQKTSEEQVYNFIHMVVKDIAVQEIQRIVAQGLPLPSMPEVSLENSDLRFTNGSVLLSTDVKYKDY